MNIPKIMKTESIKVLVGVIVVLAFMKYWQSRKKAAVKSSATEELPVEAMAYTGVTTVTSEKEKDVYKCTLEIVVGGRRRKRCYRNNVLVSEEWLPPKEPSALRCRVGEGGIVNCYEDGTLKYSI